LAVLESPPPFCWYDEFHSGRCGRKSADANGLWRDMWDEMWPKVLTVFMRLKLTTDMHDKRR
jgi:hypothetical protein